VPVTLDRQPLEPVDLRRVGGEQERAPGTLGERGLDLSRLLVAVLAQRGLGLRVVRKLAIEVLR